MKTIGSVAASALKLKLSDSTLVWASMPTFSAGWGIPILTSGPQ